MAVLHKGQVQTLLDEISKHISELHSKPKEYVLTPADYEKINLKTSYGVEGTRIIGVSIDTSIEPIEFNFKAKADWESVSTSEFSRMDGLKIAPFSGEIKLYPTKIAGSRSSADAIKQTCDQGIGPTLCLRYVGDKVMAEFNAVAASNKYGPDMFDSLSLRNFTINSKAPVTVI